jgi:hypothetical protein
VARWFKGKSLLTLLKKLVDRSSWSLSMTFPRDDGVQREVSKILKNRKPDLSLVVKLFLRPCLDRGSREKRDACMPTCLM